VRFLGFSCFVLAPNIFAQTSPNITPDVDDKLALFYLSSSTTKTIDDEIRDATLASGGTIPKDISLVKSETHKYVDHGLSKNRSQGVSPLLSAAASNSDLIVIATVVSSRSLPIKNRTFLFTENTVRVDRVFKDKTGNVRVGDLVIVSEPGGILNVNDTQVKATDPAIDRFVPHKQHIFSLKLITGTPVYKVIGPWTFAIDGGTVKPASKLETGSHSQKPLEIFAAELETAAGRR